VVELTNNYRFGFKGGTIVIHEFSNVSVVNSVVNSIVNSVVLQL